MKTPAAPQPPSPAATLLLVTLIVLAAARLVLAFVPGMAGWGLNLHRFLTPAWAWIPWSLAAVLLIPKVARALSPKLSAVATAMDRAIVPTTIAAAAAAALLVWLHPDRLGFVGDFALRLGAVRRGESPAALSPQAFPLDLLLHFDLPMAIAARTGGNDAAAVRLIGAFGAALLAGFALLLARALDDRPVVRFAAAAVVFWGGYLCLFTGESKAFAELCVLVVAFAAFAMRASTPAGVLGMGVVLALGVGLHRYALGLVPAAVVALVVRWRASRASGSRLSAMDLVGVALPIASFAVIGPRLWRTLLTYDLGANFMTAEAHARGGVLAAALDPARLLDLLNLVVMLSPLALAAPLLALMSPRRHSGRGAIVLALVAPMAFAFLFARPPQGVIRDWDSFAVPGAVFSVGAAWAIARALPAASWLALPVALAVAAPAAQWLAHFSDLPHGLARIEAFLAGPPHRTADERSRMWDMVGMKRMALEQYPAAAEAFSQAVEAAPSPRLLTQWGMAESMAGRYDQALAIYLRAVERDSSYVLAWIGVGVTGLNAGDLEAASRAAARLEQLAPGDERARQIRDEVWRRRESAPPQQP